MLELLNNPWIVGTGGGVLSGLIVTFASRYLLSRKDQKEYVQKVFAANREVVYGVRPGIPEGLIPQPQVVVALIDATARKYGVESNDLYEPVEVAQELIKEVMDSSFISAKTKEEYCDKLKSLIELPASDTERSLVGARGNGTLKQPASIGEYRTRMVRMMSMMMGLLAAMMTVFLALSKYEPFVLAVDSLTDKLKLFSPILLSVLAAALAVLLTTGYRELRSRTERESDKAKVMSLVRKNTITPRSNRRLNPDGPKKSGPPVSLCG